MKKLGIIVGIIIFVLVIIIVFFVNKNSNEDNTNIEIQKLQANIEQKIEVERLNSGQELKEENSLNNIQDINLHDIDGNETNYVFTYLDREFTAKYTKDNWKIIDSYLITNTQDMEIICKALINIHPILGKDRNSYRTAQDLVDEWELHNLAYVLLTEDSMWKENAKDVDLNPDDQGKSLEEFLLTKMY